MILAKDDIISIHALCEEGDQGIRGSCVNFIISIHALCEEGDCTLQGS